MTCPYPDLPNTKRPFRIWDSGAKKHRPGRCYSDSRRSHNGALLMIRWERPGTVLEVYNVLTGRLIGQYVRTPTTIRILRG